MQTTQRPRRIRRHKINTDDSLQNGCHKSNAPNYEYQVNLNEPMLTTVQKPSVIKQPKNNMNILPSLIRSLFLPHLPHSLYRGPHNLPSNYPPQNIIQSLFTLSNISLSFLYNHKFPLHIIPVSGSR